MLWPSAMYLRSGRLLHEIEEVLGRAPLGEGAAEVCRLGKPQALGEAWTRLSAGTGSGQMFKGRAIAGIGTARRAQQSPGGCGQRDSRP